MTGKKILLVGEVLVHHVIEFAVYCVRQRFLKLCMYYNHPKSLLNIQRAQARLSWMLDWGCGCILNICILNKTFPIPR